MSETYTDKILQHLAEAEVHRDHCHALLFEAETMYEGAMASRRMFHRQAGVVKEPQVKDMVLMESVTKGTDAYVAQDQLARAKVAKDRADSLFWQAKRTVDIYMGGK